MCSLDNAYDYMSKLQTTICDQIMRNPSEYLDFLSSWHWTRKLSKYHFDYGRRDQPGEYYFPLGRFHGDWSQDLADAMTTEKSIITWDPRKYYPDGTQIPSELLSQTQNDLRDLGYNIHRTLSDIIHQSDIGPTLIKMSEFFGLKGAGVRLHMQAPGQMFNLHIDKLYDRAEKPDDVMRIVIMLTDWEPGQFYQYGTFNFSHWRSGDVHTFDWPNVPHATANASRSVRPTMNIIGTKTARTREVLAQASAETVYWI